MLLVNEALPDETTALPKGQPINTPIDVAEYGTAEDPDGTDIWLRYYADEQIRANWDGPLPPSESQNLRQNLPGFWIGPMIRTPGHPVGDRQSIEYPTRRLLTIVTIQATRGLCRCFMHRPEPEAPRWITLAIVAAILG